MQVFVHSQEIHSVEVGDKTVLELKRIIADIEKIPVEDQALL